MTFQLSHSRRIICLIHCIYVKIIVFTSLYLGFFSRWQKIPRINYVSYVLRLYHRCWFPCYSSNGIQKSKKKKLIGKMFYFQCYRIISCFFDWFIEVQMSMISWFNKNPLHDHRLCSNSIHCFCDVITEFSLDNSIITSSKAIVSILFWLSIYLPIGNSQLLTDIFWYTRIHYRNEMKRNKNH